MEDKKIYKRIVVNLLLTITAVVLCVLFLGDLLRFFLPFVIGFFIAVIANPMVRFLEKKMKVKRKYGSAIIIVFVLGAVVGLLYLLGYFLVNEIIDLVGNFPDLMKEAQALLNEVMDSLHGFYDKLPVGVQGFIDGLGNKLDSWLDKNMTGVSLPTISQAGSYVGSFVEGLLIAIISIIAAYFFIADRDKLVEGIKKVAPASVQEYYGLVVKNIKSAIGGYFKAQFKLMLIIVVILFVGFWALGVDYAILLAMFTAFLDMLPVFGTGAVIGPWVVIDIITGKYLEAVILTILYLACQLIKQLLQPKMVGDSIGLSPLLTLFFMFVGYRFAGILGMIIGIPVGMVLVNFYKMGLFDRLIRGFKILAKSINEYRKY